jgi:L-ascorbate metabolism protein UlaG (beta-lactamase superfamily)
VTLPQCSVTRIVNACALITMGGAAVLTDPYFEKHWFVRLREPIGMTVEELPQLSAIIGGHAVHDHWQPGSLARYPFKATTPVFVATAAMARKARAAGFENVEVLDWQTTRRGAEGLSIEAVPAQPVTCLKPNNYVLASGDLRVFVGTEARDIAPLRSYRAARGAVDVALLPIDGSALAGHQLVMNAAEAIEGARALGAKVFIPFHFALKSIPLLLQTPNSVADLMRLKADVEDLEIVVLKPGERWRR